VPFPVWTPDSEEAGNPTSPEDALREYALRLQFLDALGKETAKSSDGSNPGDHVRMLGEHLGVAVCAYADMDDDKDGFTIRGNWNAPEAISIVGHYSWLPSVSLPFTHFTPAFP
jgi:hypothetical protein